jgi:hypothetical protein
MGRQHETQTRAKQDGNTDSRQQREVGLTKRHMFVILRDQYT